MTNILKSENEEHIIAINDKAYEEGMKSIIYLLKRFDFLSIAESLNNFLEKKQLTPTCVSILAAYFKDNFSDEEDIHNTFLTLTDRNYKDNIIDAQKLAMIELENQMYVNNFMHKYFVWSVEKDYVKVMYKNMEVA